VTIPVVLVAGFLGAGKTTLVNSLMRAPGDRRIAAVVNDFGAIDVDAALLGMSADGVVSLRNGCICCSLQGDLLRTLSTLTRRQPAPDAIVIETSGASDPAEIVRSMLDPVIYAVTPLDTVVTIVDARHLADRPALFDDALWRSQVAAADFCLVGKIDLVDESERTRIRSALARFKPPSLTFDVVGGADPWAQLLLSRGAYAAMPARRGPLLASAEERFETVSWTSPRPLSLPAFQDAIGRLSPRLLRAKGFVTFTHQPGQPMLFQLVGSRATLATTDVPSDGETAASLVLIAEAGRLDLREATSLLDAAAGNEPGIRTGSGRG
jgi:cobalamin biosynthesis protein CobW